MSDSYYEGKPLRLMSGEQQLLMDDTLVEDRWRLHREIYLPEKHARNPLITPDEPWEGDYFDAPSVMWDEDFGKYRMWYGAIHASSVRSEGLPKKYVLYAESTNGIDWVKPLFDFYSYKSIQRTNIVYMASDEANPTRFAVCDRVFKDPDDADPARRYKMLVDQEISYGGEYRRGLNLAVSPDGIRWTLDRPIWDINSDTSNQVVFNPSTKRWHLYCRPKFMQATGPNVKGIGQKGGNCSRKMAVSTSPDLENWSYPRTCLYPDERDAPDYDANCVFRFGSHFINLYTAMDDDTDGGKEAKLASSGDGIHWSRFHTREPFISRGREGDWDAGAISRLSMVMSQLGDRLFVYYQATPKGKRDFYGRGGIGLVQAEPGRFVMQTAGNETGWLLTREFILNGNRLWLNATYRHLRHQEQELRVEVVQHPEMGGHERGFTGAFEGFTLEDCDPLVQNGINIPVTWRGNPDLSALTGKAVYLRFRLRNMSLFSFRVGDE